MHTDARCPPHLCPQVVANIQSIDMNGVIPAPRREYGSKLENLPTEVLTLILSFKDMTQPTIRLFLTGAITMRQKTCRSATIMRFQSRLVIDFSLLPSILGYLSNLRELSIICDKSPLISTHHTLSLLRLISPTLVKLVFRFLGSAHFFEPGPHLAEDGIMTGANKSDDSNNKHVDNDYVDLAKHFPRLQWLEMASFSDPLCSTLKWLPATLTRLECRLNLLQDTHVTLPPHLIHLKVFSNKDIPQSFFDALPPSLETLDFRWARSLRPRLEWILALPKSLKKLVLPYGCVHHEFTHEMILAIPPHMEALVNLPNTIAKYLPTTLTRFETGRELETLSGSDLRQLPRSLAKLAFSLNHQDTIAIGDLPSALKHITVHLHDNPSIDNFGTLLPSKQLTSLLIVSFLTSVTMISQIPATLTHFSLSTSKLTIEESDLLHLPPNLTSLAITAYDKSTMPLRFANMPNTITHLDLRKVIAFSDFFMLPDSLCKLSIGKVIDMSLFDPSDTKTIDRILHLRKVAHDSGLIVDENLPTHKPRYFGFFDLLPRTITKLHFVDGFECETLPVTAWQSLPKCLKTLEIWGSWLHAFPPETLDYMPYDSVTKSLRLPHVVMRNEHVKRLNPKLDQLAFVLARPCVLTRECIPWIPRSSRLPFSLLALESEYVELNKKRRECLQAFDRPGFNALISMSNQ